VGLQEQTFQKESEAPLVTRKEKRQKERCKESKKDRKTEINFS
jgi:hypothetical protein